MTNIKCKKNDPKFKQQQQQPGQSSSSNAPNGQQGQKKKKFRGKRAGKNNGGQASHNHAHTVSHIASAAIIAPTPSPLLPTTTTVASFTPSGISTKKRPVNPPAEPTFRG
ncbi:hypothetical protein NMY22_g20035 [Coprinellus aureogranulatus]|nr:hypothetical protein NMY22_g20035 [Coprinellus aureogranulatus]